MDQPQKTPPSQVDIMRLNSVVSKKVRMLSNGRIESEPVFGTVDFPVQKESDIAGMGQPMSLPFLIDQINEYNVNNIRLFKDLQTQLATLENMIQAVEKQDEEATKSQRVKDLTTMLDVTKRAYELVGSKEVAINMGKESLMLILSQKDCEGIRFYFCNSPYGNSSVAAVGVRTVRDSRGQARQADHPQVPNRKITMSQDIGIDSHHLSIIEAPASAMKAQILNEEVGPPYRTKQYFEEQEFARNPEEDLEDAFIVSLRQVYSNLL